MTHWKRPELGNGTRNWPGFWKTADRTLPVTIALSGLLIGISTFGDGSLLGTEAAAGVVLDVNFQPPLGTQPLSPMSQVGTSGIDETDWSVVITDDGGTIVGRACNVGGTGLAATFSAVPVSQITDARFDLRHPNATPTSLAPMNINLFFDDTFGGVDVTVISTSSQSREIDFLSEIQSETGRELIGIQLNGYINAIDRSNSVTCVDNIHIQSVPEPSTWIHLSLVVGLTLWILLKQPLVVVGLKDNTFA